MTNPSGTSDNLKKYRAAQANRALGVFILFFGIVVIIAIFFTDTTIGKMTNGAAGGLLSLIGGGMTLLATRTIKQIKPNEKR